MEEAAEVRGFSFDCGRTTDEADDRTTVRNDVTCRGAKERWYSMADPIVSRPKTAVKNLEVA
jgi:hypothetical protein